MEQAQLENFGHGAFYWFFYHIKQGTKNLVKKHKKVTIFLLMIFIALSFFYRAPLHPCVLFVRLHLFSIAVFVFAIFWALILKKLIKLPAVVYLFNCFLMLVLIFVSILYGSEIQHYIGLYKQYHHIKQVELTSLPETSFERIHPLNAVYSLAYEAMSETETPRKPSYVRIGDKYRWTMAIEPAHLWTRTFGTIEELFNISATTIMPNFSKDKRVKVNFKTGETLFLSHQVQTAVIKTFNIWRYLNYEPADVLYFTDDDGEWVQVVPLIRWRGLLFPRPEFGGVQIIRQMEGSTLKLILFGAGTWLSPQEVKNKRFLNGQNIMPLQVSRYIAESFRFQKGFFAPLPWSHNGDVRIPDLPSDVNDEPFPSYFKFSDNQSSKIQSKIYQYFGLEPYDSDKQGLSISVFVPADAEHEVYVYRHYQKEDFTGSMTGVSAIAAKVMESRKEYDWQRNRPVEHRPYIKKIDGKIHFFWLTTVVTSKEQGSNFISGSEPSLVLTDATYNKSIWLNPLEQDKWINEIKEAMQPLWNEQ